MRGLKLNILPRTYHIHSQYNATDEQSVYFRTRINRQDMAALVAAVSLEMECLAIFSQKLDYFIAEDKTIAEVLSLISGRIVGKPTNTAFCVLLDPSYLSELQQCHNVFGERYSEISLIVRDAVRSVFIKGLSDANSLVWSSINDATTAIHDDLTDLGEQWQHH